jgi:cystathionine beta-lyase
VTIFNLTESELRKRQSMKWLTYPADVLPLWVAEMDCQVPAPVKQAIYRAIEDGDTGYPAGRGYADAFRGFAERRWGLQLSDDQVKQSGDVMNSMLGVLQAVSEPGDAVVINPPVYPPFRTIVDNYQRRLVEAPMNAEGRLDFAAIERALAEKPKAYLLCSPHNPTGAVHTAAELTRLAELCNTAQVPIIVDEIHAPIVTAGTRFTSILAVPGGERAVISTSAGKAWNLACFKGGLVVGGSEAHDTLAKLPAMVQQSMGHIAAIAHAAAMNHADAWLDEYLQEIVANQRLLADLLAEQVPGARYVPAAGTYFAWVDCSALGLDNPALHFRQAGKVAFNVGTTFGREYGQWVRINLATSPQIITEAVRRMAASIR